MSSGDFEKFKTCSHVWTLHVDMKTFPVPGVPRPHSEFICGHCNVIISFTEKYALEAFENQKKATQLQVEAVQQMKRTTLWTCVAAIATAASALAVAIG